MPSLPWLCPCLLPMLVLAGCDDAMRHNDLRSERGTLQAAIPAMEKLIEDAKPRFEAMSEADKSFYGRLEVELIQSKARLTEIEHELAH